MMADEVKIDAIKVIVGEKGFEFEFNHPEMETASEARVPSEATENLTETGAQAEEDETSSNPEAQAKTADPVGEPLD